MTGDDETTTFEIRRNSRLSGWIGLSAAVVAIAWLARAADAGSALDWVICVVLTGVALLQLVAMVDARTPLLAADDQGVRIRLAGEWLGLPWSTLEQVVVEQRDTRVRDGRLVLVPRNPGNVMEALQPASRRAAGWQRRLHGAPLAVPLSIATRTTSEPVLDVLTGLAAGRTEIAAIRGRERAHLAVEHSRAEVGRLLSRLGGGHDIDHAVDHDTAHAVDRAGPVTSHVVDPAAARTIDPVAAVRSARKVMRADVVRDRRSRVATADVVVAPTDPAPVSPDGPVVVGGFERSLVERPVIGPRIAAARHRARLSVDELSERTRIRPHVLEAIEVDDFGPCGGDFYARGHLRTLGRYLGLAPEELVAAYDDRYSHGPINARRVFEAELATGMGGGLRATTGGPRWGLLAGAVLSLLLVWGVARYFTEPPAPVTTPDTAGLAAHVKPNTQPITSPLTTVRRVKVKAVGARSRVQVRDRHGALLWSGTLHRGQEHGMAGIGPFTVRASNGQATRVKVGRHWRGQVGMLPTPARRVVG